MKDLLAGSWTLSWARDLWPFLTLSSIVRYRRHLLRQSAGVIPDGALLRLQLRKPFDCTIHLRETGSDLAILDEVILRDQVYRRVIERIPDCRTIIDLGANVGLATVYLAAHYPRARIFSVEPNPPSYEALCRNIAPLASVGRVRALCAAVWSAEISLAADPTAPAQNAALFSAREVEDASGTIAGYPMTRLLDLAGFAYADLVKVDIEGAERQLFSGDLTWLERVGALAIEFHDGSRAETGFDALMEKHGFVIDSEQRHTVVALRIGAHKNAPPSLTNSDPRN